MNLSQRKSSPTPAARRVRPGLAGSSDAYRSDHKHAEPVVCPDCRAVQEKGRWRWREALPGAAQVLCPACRRIREEFPDGHVLLSGPFFREHRDEVMARIRHVSDRARLASPLQRLMRIDEDDLETRIETTSAHLARSIGRALHAAFQGELVIDAHAEGRPRVHWSR